MTLLPIALVTAAVLILAYRTYGTWLAKKFKLDPDATTPAVEMRDGQDFEPIEPKFLIGQHFSAIAAAGPIVGPILAGLAFGWGPALLWILIGSVLIGGIHDMGSMVASLRHRAQSIAEVVREHMNRRSYALFLTFIWLALVYIIVAFTDITASAFVNDQVLADGQIVKGSGIATSSLLYLLLPVAMGLLLKTGKIGLVPLTVIFVPLIVFAIWFGQQMPLDLGALLGLSKEQAHKVWDGIILGYCVLAAIAPMWLLLQPRGHLGGVFLYFFLAIGVVGMLFMNRAIQYPVFTGWTNAAGQTLAPFLFITIACGAVSGFHSLISSGTTSKQLRRETDAKVVGYGTMLMEAGVAVLALSCVMMLASGSDLTKKEPNAIFASGISGFLAEFGIDPKLAFAIMLMAFTTFVYDTLDVCTRLGRYIVQELTGWKDRKGMWLGTLLTAGVPLLFVTQQLQDKAGKPIPAWRVFWGLFGASNQLLAALALLGVTVWLWRTQRAKWALFAAGIPCLLMYTMSCWALTVMILNPAAGPEKWVAIVLVGLALWMLVEALSCFLKGRQDRFEEPAATPA